ncbi:MAG: hypothetical protein M1479_07985, partial [Actinobacteria bacterium]|nr:hypothetical protein [Actinomycetota bacterium]
MKRKIHKKSKHPVSNIILIMVLLIFFIPVFWIVLTSIRPNIEINTRPPVWIPHSLSFSSYAALAGYTESAEDFGFGQSVPFLAYAKNSIIASTASTILALVVGTFAGFIFSSFKFKGKDSIFLSFMLARAVPGIALGLPLLVLFTRLGLSDKIYGLIIAYAASFNSLGISSKNPVINQAVKGTFIAAYAIINPYILSESPNLVNKTNNGSPSAIPGTALANIKLKKI